jgi:RND family efflux transporter MFP subunit
LLPWKAGQILAGGVVLVAVATLFPGLTSAEDGPVQVSVVKPEMRVIKRSIEQPGLIRADLESPLAAKLTGYVSSVRVDIGDRVKAGQVLAELSVPELDEEVNLKQAIVQQSELAVKQARLAKDTAQAQVETAQALFKEAEAGRKRAESNYERWSSEAQRFTELTKGKVIDPQSRDETINQAKAAEASRDEALAKIESARSSVRRWQSELARAEVDILAEQAKLSVAVADARRVVAMQGYKTIKAPFDGIVTRRNIDPGVLLQPGKPDVLFVVATFDKVRVIVDIPETDAVLINKGDVATIRIPSLEGRVFTGSVARSSWSLDPQNRTLRVEIDLENAAGILRPAMYVNAGIAVKTQPVRTLPAKSLAKAGETHSCFIVEGGKAVRLRVRAGRSDGKFTEVVQKQGADGAWVPFGGDEQVIETVPANLRDGQPVQIVK